MIILYLCGHNINVNDIRNYFSDSLIKLQSFPNITNNFKKPFNYGNNKSRRLTQKSRTQRVVF